MPTQPHPAQHLRLGELRPSPASISADRVHRPSRTNPRGKWRPPATLAWWLLALSPALMVASAIAAPVIPPAISPAIGEEELIDRGIALREARNDAAALDAFRQAYHLKQGARPLAQMALAEQALGRWVEAEADLTKAISRGDDPWIQKNANLLHQALLEIQGHLGSLQLTGGVPGAQLFVNDVSAGTLPLATPLRVTAGTATLEVRAANYLPTRRAVTIPRQGIARETVTLVPAALAATPSASVGRGEAEDRPSWPTRTKIGVAVGAAAVVSAAVGTTFLFVRDSRAQDFNDAGCGTEALTAPCASLRDSEKSAVTWAVTGLVGAAVLGGVSAYLLWWPSAPDAGGPAQNGTSLGLLGCSPSAAGGVSLTCGGRF